MKGTGRRFDIRTSGHKVSGWWDEATQTVATYRGGVWITGPAETMDQARDWLRTLVTELTPFETPFDSGARRRPGDSN